jgi:cyclopropane-fatty-acyl-phospholipid synthase
VIRTGAKPGLIERLSRRMLFAVLEGLEYGTLDLIDTDGVHRFGGSGKDIDVGGTMWIHDPRAYPAMAFGGSVGAGRSYLEGWWDADDLTRVMRLFSRNAAVLDRWRRGPARIMDVGGLGHRLRRRNTRDGSRDNIAAHYDLSNDFFATFLDSSMMYSSAFYPTPGATLEEAAVAKIDRIGKKLALGPGDHLLEIGTGWGALAVRLARETGCRVTTTTISAEQHRLAVARVREAGLQDRVTVLQKDYRDLTGRYDKLVSVEMIEAVGPEYLDGFFETCDRLLSEDGLMLLQAIVIDDREYRRASRSVDFIKHFIFPGSCIPSVARMTEALAGHTRLRLIDLEDITGHYATTLCDWRERFDASTPALAKLGFDQRFRRMWAFYFSYCEAGFRERRIGDVQMLLAGPDFRGSAGHVPSGERG